MPEHFWVSSIMTGLALYHLGMGVMATFSAQRAARAVQVFYGASLTVGGGFTYLIRMIGLLATALGSLMAIAAWNPAHHRAVIVISALLLIGRAIARHVNRQLLVAELGVPLWRNGLNIALLVALATSLVLTLPSESW